MLLIIVSVFNASSAMGFGLKNVYQNLHINNTAPGNYQDAAAGWYSGGSSVIRTKNTAIRPFAMNAPSLSSGCNGIDAFLGSFSMISAGELVTIAENIGSQAIVYGFHLGMKTYAPQIEQVLKDLRNLQMQLNQFGIGHCKAVQAGYAAMLPKNSAMYETVCDEMAADSGNDLGGQRKKCRNHAAQKAAVAKAQAKDPELLMDNYNIFTKAAQNAGIPKALRSALMSMMGTIVVIDGVMIPYPSLASDSQSWNIHINGGSGASAYTCNNDACLKIALQDNIVIKKENSYAGKARAKLDTLVVTMRNQLKDFELEEKRFLDSLGSSFPIFDHITLEAISGHSILDGSSELIARYMLLAHLKSITYDIKKSVIALKQKQMNEKYLVQYEKSLDRLLDFAQNEWAAVMLDADRINDRAEKLEKHLIARERS